MYGDARAGIVKDAARGFELVCQAFDQGFTPALYQVARWAVQVDPVKPKLKPPEIKRLKLKCYIRLSTPAFKFNLRRYSEVLLEGRGGGVLFNCY